MTVQDDAKLWDAQAHLIIASDRKATRDLLRLLRPDGRVVHAVCTVAVLTDTDNEQYFLAHMQDVSEEVAAQNLLRLAVENTPLLTFLVDQTGRVLECKGTVSPEAAARLQVARRSSVFETFADLPQVTSMLRQALEGRHVHGVIEVFGRCLDMHLVPVPSPGHRAESIAAVATDVTDLQHALASVRSQSAEQAMVADISQRALEARDTATLWGWAIPALVEHLDVDLAQAYELDESGNQIGLLAQVDRREQPAAFRIPSAEADATRPTGSMNMPVGRPGQPLAIIELQRVSAEAPFTDQDRRFVKSVATVLGSATLRLRMESEIRHRSLHDGLTGLPSRTALLDQLDQELRQALRNGRRVGVLFVDLDGFKTVNDTLGHHAGDALLRTTAARLTRAVRSGDVVGRLGGDEFAVLCADVRGAADLEEVADRIGAVLAEETLVRDHVVNSTASVGIALSGPDLRDGEKLLNAADIAMYAAKRAGPGRHAVYSKAMQARLTDQMTSTEELRRALGANELVMMYQAVRTSSGNIAGAEAVPHWRRRAHGLLRIENVLPHLPQPSLRAAVTRWALTTTCRTAARLPDLSGGQPGQKALITVGVYGPCLIEDGFVSELAALLDETGTDTRFQLCIVVSEDDLCGEYAAFATALTTVRDLGVMRCIGHFGSDASPDLPTTLPFDYLRIAAGQLRGIDQDRTKRAAIAAVIHFAHLLGTQVIAVGIEDHHQLEVLQTLDCDLVEGSLLDPASPRMDIARGT